MHHYKNTTINLTVLSAALLKDTARIIGIYLYRKNTNWSTTSDNFPVRSLMTGKIAKRHYGIFFFTVSSRKGEIPVMCFRFSLCQGKSSLKISFRCKNKPE